MSDLTTLQKNITNLAEAIAADVMALYSKAGGDVTLEELANIVSGHTTSINQLGVSVGNKVDKVVGKGLSTSDFTADEKSKLTGIATGATKNRADTLNADKVHSHVMGEVIGLDASLADKVDKVAGQGLSSNDLTGVLLAKLNGIAAGATKNATDAQLRDRSTHTGTQAISTVTGLQAAIDSKVSTEVGKGLSTNDYTTAEKNKLASMESSRFRGTYTTLAALISAVQTPEAGFYADVDSGEGSDVQRHIYDVTDDKWVVQQSATDITAAQVKQMYESNPDTNPFQDSDKMKLTGIATGATKNRADTANADKLHSHQQSEVVGLVDSLATKVDKVTGKELSTNDYTTVEKNKLTGIATGATKNATDAQLRDRTTHTGVQAIATVSGLQDAIDSKVSTEDGKGLSTNDYTTVEKGKLTGIETGAQKNVPTNLSLSRDGVNVDVKSSTGDDVSIPSATSVLAGVLSGADKTKLDGIATGATKNATDALLRDRSTHTGTQTMSTVVDLVDTLDGKVDGILGKGLSTNDYTTVEKNKLTGVEAGATKNRTDASVDTLLGNKVDKVTGKGLSTKDYTAIEEAKLAGIEVGATKNRTDTAVDVLLGEKVDIEDGKGLSTNDYTTVEKSKLTGIATGATKNRTDASVDTLLGNKVDKVTGKGLSTNDYTTTEKNKLNGIAAGATANRTDASVDTLLANKVDKVTGKGLSTNDYTTAEKSKLTGIAAGATKNATDAQLRDRTTHTGVQEIGTVTGLQDAIDSKVDKVLDKSLIDDSEITRLGGIETGATKNATDAQLRNRATHTGTQAVGTITGLGNVATRNVGTAINTIMAGDDSRVVANTTKLAGIATGATKNAADATLLNRANHTGVQTTSTITGLDAALLAKVDKVTGKGLSTNDYTTAEKSKLTGIAAGATANRVDSENADKAHTHTWSQVTGAPATATRWPTLAEVTGKPANYPTDWDTVSDKPIVQTTGTSTTNLMSQAATTDAIDAAVANAASSGPRPTKDHGDVAVVGPETVTCDVQESDFHIMSLRTSDRTGSLTIDFTNMPDTLGKHFSWHVRLNRGGRKTVEFAQTINWAGGVAPTFTTALSGQDLILFYKVDSETIRGMVIDAW